MQVVNMGIQSSCTVASPNMADLLTLNLNRTILPQHFGLAAYKTEGTLKSLRGTTHYIL